MARTKRRRITILLIVTGIVLAAVIGLVFIKKRAPAIAVQTEKVSRRNLIEAVVANGRIQPVVQVKISPEVSGEITELPVKEGQPVNKGDLLLKIKPDVYIAATNQADAAYKSALAGQSVAEANLDKAADDFQRYAEQFREKLIPESTLVQYRAAFDVARAQVSSAEHQVEMANASLASMQEELAKTTIVSPLTGTISKLNSQAGERVLGTVQNVGTDIMTISDLNQMEARVDVGELDVVLIRPGQKARLDVDAFKDRKFTGVVTAIANSSKGMGLPYTGTTSQSQDATKFEVRIRINENEAFRPGMSVSAEIETRYRTNALAVPLASVTTRPPKPTAKTNGSAKNNGKGNGTNSAPVVDPATNVPFADKKSKDVSKPSEVVFVVDGSRVKMLPVKIGICDDSYWEITEGLTEGQEIVSGGYRAISRDLDDGKRIRKGAGADQEPKK